MGEAKQVNLSFLHLRDNLFIALHYLHFLPARFGHSSFNFRITRNLCRFVCGLYFSKTGELFPKCQAVGFILDAYSAQHLLLISPNMHWSIAESPTNCLAICFEEGRALKFPSRWISERWLLYNQP